MPRAAHEHPVRFLAIAIFLGTAIVLAAAGRRAYFQVPILEQGDIAVNALQVDDAKGFAELYGNYSRFEFNHPGPAFFYVYAAGELVFHDLLGVSPSPGNAHQLAGMLLQVAFFSAAIAILGSLVGSRWFVPLLLLAAVAIFGPRREPFISIWPPHVLLMPFLLLLASGTSVALGRIRHLPAAAVAAAFLLHGHVAQPLMVVALGSAMGGLALFRLRAEHPSRGIAEFLRANTTPISITAAIAVVTGLPVVIDLMVFGSRGNVATIIGRFYANTGDSKGVLQSFLYLASFGTPTRDQEDLFTVFGSQTTLFLARNSPWLVFWAAIFVGGPLLYHRLRAHLDGNLVRFSVAAYTLLAAACIGSVLWGLAQAGPMAHFNGYFYYAIYLFALVPPIALLARALETRLPARLAPVACLCAAVGAAWFLRPAPLDTAAMTGIPIRNGVDAAVQSVSAPETGRPLVLSFEHALWPEAAAVALQLQRDGTPFRLAPWWEFMFGSRHDLGDAEGLETDALRVWWIAQSDDGIPITPRLDLFTGPAPIDPSGSSITFQGGGNAFRFTAFGISTGNIEFAHTDMKRVLFRFSPEPAEADIRVVFDAMAVAVNKALETNQRAEVLFNGESLGTIHANVRDDLAVTVPAALWNAVPEANLELVLPDARPSRSYKRPRYESWSAWRIWSIRFEPAA
jgi:hypothetical protein